MNVLNRRGFSLMEVLLSTALLMGCVVVLTELANVGRVHIQKAEKLAAAELICQSALNEILIGEAASETIERRPIAGSPGWLVSVYTQPLEKHPLLTELEVTVAEDLPEDESAVEFTLTRWMFTPDSQDESGEESDKPSVDSLFDDFDAQPDGGGLTW